MTALHTGDLLPPADVPFGGPAGGAPARYRVAAAPPGIPAYHTHTVGPAYLPGTVVAEGSAAKGALDYPVGFFLFQNDVSKNGNEMRRNIISLIAPDRLTSKKPYSRAFGFDKKRFLFQITVNRIR